MLGSAKRCHFDACARVYCIVSCFLYRTVLHFTWLRVLRYQSNQLIQCFIGQARSARSRDHYWASI